MKDYLSVEIGGGLATKEELERVVSRIQEQLGDNMSQPTFNKNIIVASRVSYDIAFDVKRHADGSLMKLGDLIMEYMQSEQLVKFRIEVKTQ